MYKKSSVTRLLHYKIECCDASASVTPIFQCSAFSSESEYFYSRKNNPNVVEFEQSVAMLEGSNYALAYACGMTAIYMVLDLLKAGDVVVISSLLYGCSYKLFQRLSLQRGFTLQVLDLHSQQCIQKIPENVSMIFFETPTNPFLKVIDIKKVSHIAKQRNPKALIVVDNTWASPLYQSPLEFGADISLHSGTKYLSGHSDVMGGVVLINDTDLYEKMKQDRFYAGTIITPYHAWLMRRSLQTLEVRLEHQAKTTKEMVKFLSEQKEIDHVFYPEVDGKQLKQYGGIVFITLATQYSSQYKKFSNSLELFGTGTGMACVTSMVAQPYTGSHASMEDTEKEKMGITKNLVRLCFGLEKVEDLKKDIKQALQSLSKKSFAKYEV